MTIIMERRWASRSKVSPIALRPTMPIEPSCQRAPGGTRDEDRGSARLQSDFSVYGVRKVARSGASSSAENFHIVRSTVSPLMRDMGLQETIRGEPVQTSSDKAAACQQDSVNRQFQSSRPNALWHSDFTYLATWTGSVYLAFVIGAYAQSIVGWRA
ncbi:hypothetical protein [Bradyrhizobium yuanmingense]|uniref:hypothetical protein n=1 Tax=Bradyrhizobium yuanmingense TaxID=108015 RepID=UPI003B96B7DC